jgi:tetratricopeptide (TPR) repeat protein
MTNSRALKTSVFVLILLSYTLLISTQINLPAADDIARHITNGREVLSGNFEVLHKNFYSYTMPEAPFVNHHWLSGVAFFIIYKAVGWSGLVVFKILLLLLVFSILFLLALRNSTQASDSVLASGLTALVSGKNFWLVALFSLPTMFLLVSRSALRPEIFSYFFIAIFLYLLFDLRNNPGSKRIYWLIPAQILWVNMHIFFPLGPALVALFLLEIVAHNFKKFTSNPLIKKLALTFILMLAASLLNPSGIKGMLYPLFIFSDYGLNVIENNSVTYFFQNHPLGDNLTHYAFVIAAAILAFSFIFTLKRKPRPLFFLALAVFTSFGGYQISRFISLFGMFFLPAVALNLSEAYKQAENKIKRYPTASLILSRTLVVFLLVAPLYSGRLYNDNRLGIGLSPRSEDAGKFFEEMNLKGPIFNDYDGGSYLIHYLYPREKVFVDNRPEAYTSSFFSDIYEPIFLTEDDWLKQSEVFNFNAIFLYRYDLGSGVNDFIYRRVIDPDWVLVYVDNYALIFVRNVEANQAIIDKYHLTKENILERMAYLLHSGDYEDIVSAADNFNLLGRTDLGMKTFFDVVHTWPRRGKIWMVMGQWELANDNPKSPLLAISYLERALEAGYRTAEVYYYLGRAYASIEYIDEAKKSLRKALAINPKYFGAEKLLLSLSEPE